LKHERVVKADCGSYHTIVATDTGRCFIWGKLHRFNDSASKTYFGGFSMSSGQKEPREWTQKMIDKSMQAYLAGNYNIDEEEVTNNQFGNFVSTMQSLPLLVEPLARKRVIEVAAGYAFSIAITDKGEAFSWGFNEKGQVHKLSNGIGLIIISLAKDIDLI
jgi:RCC1 and BTB domain-containing protein